MPTARETEPATGSEPLPGGPSPDAAAAIEAVLMVADAPVTVGQLSRCLDLPGDDVLRELRRLVGDYDGGDGRRRGFELREAGGGWRIYSRPEFSEVVGRFVADGQTARLTQAALETLAVIAYRQPVSRSRVSAVRGVNVDGVVRTLLTRGLVREAGTDPQTGAVLYGTTVEFLERMGLRDLDELPLIAPLLPEALALTDLEEDGSDPRRAQPDHDHE